MNLKRLFKKILISSFGCIALVLSLSSCGRKVEPGVIPDLDDMSPVLTEDNDVDNVTDDISGKKENLSAINPTYTTTSTIEASTTEDVFVDVVDYGKSVSVMITVECENGISLGSGVIYGKDDTTYYVLTNDHVVEGGLDYSIKTSQEDDVDGTLIGTSSNYDVAVLSFTSEKEYNFVYFEESEVKPGQYCFAIGTPLNSKYFNTATIGNVSLLLEGQVMHTASINSGNSGGPLLNSKGNLIGLNNSKLSGETSSGASVENMFFAISIDYVEKAIKEINSPKLGITTVNVSSVLTIAQCENYNQAYFYYGITYNQYTDFINYSQYIPSGVENGLLVVLVDENSCSYNHIDIFDVLIEIDKKVINDVNVVKNVLIEKNKVDNVIINLYRSNELLEVTIALN